MNGLAYTDCRAVNTGGAILAQLNIITDNRETADVPLSAQAQEIVARIVRRFPDNVAAQVALALSCALDFAGNDLAGLAGDYLRAARYMMQGTPIGSAMDLLA